MTSTPLPEQGVNPIKSEDKLTQEELAEFIKDPETLARCIEGSMEKRCKSMNPIKSEAELRIGNKTFILDGVNPIRFKFDGDPYLYQCDENGDIFCVEPIDHIRQPAKKLTTNQEGEK